MRARACSLMSFRTCLFWWHRSAGDECGAPQCSIPSPGQGLRVMAAGAQTRVASVVVQWDMQGMQGVQECRRVQKSTKSAPSQLMPCRGCSCGVRQPPALRVWAQRAVKDGEQLSKRSPNVTRAVRNVETPRGDGVMPSPPQAPWSVHWGL